MIETLESRRMLAFGVTNGTAPTGQPTYVVDNGGDLKFSVIRGGSLSSTLHLADISAIQYKNKEVLATYAVTSRYSHYEQGLGSATVISYTVDNANGWILVKCDDSIASDDSATQYYAVRRNDNNIYMASLPTNVNGGPGEGRFIAYLSRSVFANPEEPSDLAGNNGAIEGGDVFGFADGTTASKFYNMGRRMIENEYHGVTGSASGTPVGAWMFMGSRERSSGGAFFKDIDFQSGSAVEIYNCIFTGHTQTEAYRQGLHTYAFQFTDGSLPVEPDYSWLENAKDTGGNLLIGGLIPASQRGAISGKATGNPVGHENVVALSNSEAQYWDMADASGNYAIADVLPGTYTETLYANELEVGQKTVTITAGATTHSNIVNTLYIPSSPIFRIGAWDGMPLGFMNADKIETMHPSDVRMSNWASTPNFVVGTNTDAQWPMAQFMGVNNSQRISFNLTAAQVQNLTLRIGITLGFEGGRNQVIVNSGQSFSWTSAFPSASRDLNSRGITRGTWRGDNQLYTYNIPSTAFQVGLNTIDLPVISGSYAEGQTWLSPNVAYDAIDVVPTTSATAPAIASVTITPANSTVGINSAQAFTAIARSATGSTITSNIDWSALRGGIDPNGNYIAPATSGADTITALAKTTRTPGYLTTRTSTSAVGDTISGTGNTSVNVLANSTDIAWYKADLSAGTTLPDSSGNNLTANLTGSYSFVPGVNGNSLRLSGGAATLPAGIVGTLNDFTVATWVRPDALTASDSWERIFDFGNGGATPTTYMFLTTRASTTGRPRFAITTAGAAAEQGLDSSITLTAGQWAHVAVTLSGNTATIYVNGIARGTALITLRPSSLGNTTQNFIGDSQWTADPSFLGNIDDFRIDARPLAPAEIAALAGGAVNGRAFHDTNANGSFDPAEPTLDNVQVYLDANGSGTQDAGELSTTTSGGGNYSFADVPAGNYTVREVAAPTDFVLTSAPAVTVGSGTTSTRDLANARVVYAGTSSADDYRLRKNVAGHYEILIGGSLAYTVFAAAPSLTFNLLGGDDVLTLDFANGAPVPIGRVNYDGGAGAGDEISVVTTAGAETLAFNASAITFAGIAGTLQHAGVEAARFDGNGGWDTITINGGPAVTFADAQKFQSLALTGSALARFALSAGTTVARDLSILGTATLDLADSTVIIDTTDPAASGAWNGSAYSGYLGLIAAGYNYSAWDGHGIVTTRPQALVGLTTVAVATGEQALGIGASDTAEFAGETINGRSVILKYTYAGDLNLDGLVDAADYGVIDNFVQFPGTHGYANGDFNFDGVIDAADYGIIDNSIQLQGPQL